MPQPQTSREKTFSFIKPAEIPKGSGQKPTDNSRKIIRMSAKGGSCRSSDTLSDYILGNHFKKY